WNGGGGISDAVRGHGSEARWPNAKHRRSSPISRLRSGKLRNGSGTRRGRRNDNRLSFDIEMQLGCYAIGPCYDKSSKVRSWHFSEVLNAASDGRFGFKTRTGT